jgi:very-short-patch-repair endonuclease
MSPAQIVAEERVHRGAKVLKDYLEYAEFGKLEPGAPSGKEPGSDFEIAVARALGNQGYQIVAQVGVGEYCIDLAVRHPITGSFLLGIECDGAAYHSSKSARDRDRIREEALKRLKWSLHRIWSTDWFLNPEREVREKS